MRHGNAVAAPDAEAETPLDVLSRAASLVTEEARRPANKTRERRSERDATSSIAYEHKAKDLRFRSLKLNRKKRRERERLLAKLKAQRTTSTQTSMSLVSVSESSGTEPSASAGMDEMETAEDSCEEADAPLDMTTTSRYGFRRSCDDNGASSVSKRRAASGHGAQQRPSVITCVASSDRDGADEDAQHGHRWEISAGMCDPVIDEHFRRSLGKDYPECLSDAPVPSAVNVCGLSVDDHFSKALGDIWLQLKKKNYSSGSNSTSLSSDLTKSSSAAAALVQRC